MVKCGLGRLCSLRAFAEVVPVPNDLLEAELAHSIVGAFLTVYNYYGYGLSERVYAGALEIELRDRGHIVARELFVDVRYKGQRVATQRLDMVIDDKIVVENKATEKLSTADRYQLINYLRATKFEVGLLLHFGAAPKFERFIDYPKQDLPVSTGSTYRR
jgi:GxxExxY protein